MFGMQVVRSVWYRRLMVGMAVLAVLAMSAVSAFAQATQEPYSTSSLLSDSHGAYTTWGLDIFVVAVAIMLLAFFGLRRLIRGIRVS